MTVSGTNNSPSCRDIRHLLGVYVLGAIDPAERSVVDEHVPGCLTCRDELAGLAGLPAMLGRVPATDVERLGDGPAELASQAEPPGEVLNALLTTVAVGRRRRLRRGIIGVAASAAVIAAGAVAAVELSRPAAQAGHTEVASATSRSGVAAVVDYSTTPWNSTTMRVQVSGIRPGTTCQFWVVGQDGRAFAGSWTVQDSYGQQAWYPAVSQAPLSSVHSFQLTAGGKVLLTIPAR